MTFAASTMAVIGGTQLLGGLLGSNASKKAAQAQLQAARESAAAQERMFNKSVELQEPFRQGGVTGLNRLMFLLGEQAPGGSMPTGYSQADFGSAARPFSSTDFEADPGYAFRMSEGMKALDRSAAARGGLLSGSTVRGAQRYGQDLASQEYQNAFNRYQIERQARLNPLQSLAGMGQSTAGTLASNALGYGQQMGENAAQMGNIRASQYMGQANALSNALSGMGNMYMQGQILNRFAPPPTTPGASTPGASAANSPFGYSYGK